MNKTLAYIFLLTVTQSLIGMNTSEPIKINLTDGSKHADYRVLFSKKRLDNQRSRFMGKDIFSATLAVQFEPNKGHQKIQLTIHGITQKTDEKTKIQLTGYFPRDINQLLIKKLSEVSGRQLVKLTKDDDVKRGYYFSLDSANIQSTVSLFDENSSAIVNNRKWEERKILIFFLFLCMNFLRAQLFPS